MNLQSATALVTGGSAGIGRAMWAKTADQILASIARFAQRTFDLQDAQHVSRTTGTGR
jgi:NAD(P)-dependent dehydrogenase (short-subunit alcohol dehydrogenase family)